MFDGLTGHLVNTTGATPVAMAANSALSLRRQIAVKALKNYHIGFLGVKLHGRPTYFYRQPLKGLSMAAGKRVFRRDSSHNDLSSRPGNQWPQY